MVFINDGGIKPLKSSSLHQLISNYKFEVYSQIVRSVIFAIIPINRTFLCQLILLRDNSLVTDLAFTISYRILDKKKPSPDETPIVLPKFA